MVKVEKTQSKDSKHILLTLDNNIFLKLKEMKEKGGYKSWEDFVLNNLLKVSEDELKKKKIEQMKEKLYEFYNEIEYLSDYKYELELIRVITLQLLEDNILKARAITKELLQDLDNKGD